MVRDLFFPRVFSVNYVLFVAYAVRFVATLLVIAVKNRLVCRAHAILNLLSVATLLVHQQTFNDAGTTTGFWVAAWLFWFAFTTENNESVSVMGPYLALCIVSLLFLGGAIGKLTPVYLYGEFFYENYFKPGNGIGASAAQLFLNDAQLRVFARWVSWSIIFAEFSLSMAFLLPPRFGLIYAAVATLGMYVFSSFVVFAVTGQLHALFAANLWLLFVHQRNAPEDDQSRKRIS